MIRLSSRVAELLIFRKASLAETIADFYALNYLDVENKIPEDSFFERKYKNITETLYSTLKKQLDIEKERKTQLTLDKNTLSLIDSMDRVPAISVMLNIYHDRFAMAATISSSDRGLIDDDVLTILTLHAHDNNPTSFSNFLSPEVASFVLKNTTPSDIPNFYSILEKLHNNEDLLQKELAYIAHTRMKQLEESIGQGDSQKNVWIHDLNSVKDNPNTHPEVKNKIQLAISSDEEKETMYQDFFQWAHQKNLDPWDSKIQEEYENLTQNKPL